MRDVGEAGLRRDPRDWPARKACQQGEGALQLQFVDACDEGRAGRIEQLLQVARRDVVLARDMGNRERRIDKIFTSQLADAVVIAGLDDIRLF